MATIFGPITIDIRSYFMSDSRNSEDVLLSLRDLYLKPCVKSVGPEIYIFGSREVGKSLRLSDSREAVESFRDCFRDLFIGRGREKYLRQLCFTLSKLVAGTLRGQQNCFLGLGVKGIGKSQFFIALGDWMTRIGDTNCAFIYLEMGNSREDSIYNMKTTNVCKIVHHFALLSEWSETPADAWASITACVDWLNSHSRRVFLVLDEFEKCFAQENTAGLLSDLSGVGGWSGERPIVIVLLGSSSYLRNLCFCKGEEEVMLKAGYKGYSRAWNLNSTKYMPLVFEPITTVDETIDAMRSLGLGGPHEGFDIQLFCKATRGQLRSFVSIYEQLKEGNGIANGLVARREATMDAQENILKILWGNVQQVHTEDVVSVMNFSSVFTEDIQRKLSCPRQKFIDVGLTLSDLYNCADNSLIRFEGDDVSFLHPTDLELCLNLFGKEVRADGLLTMAERVSLLHADNARTDEINKKLVCESLCERGIVVEGIGKLTFERNSPNYNECCTGVVRQGTILTQMGGDNLRILEERYLGNCKKGVIYGSTVTPAVLCKENPDELGSDLIAIYKAESFPNVKFVIVRVQVKLGRSKGSVDSGGTTPIQRMIRHEPRIAAALNVAADQIIFIRVLWTSQPTHDTSSRKDHIIVIKSEDMLNYWIDPVKKFIVQKRITAYGFKK